MDRDQSQNWSSAILSRSGLVLIGFLGVAGYFLWTEHQAHLTSALSYLPWLLFLLCPLMHLFMHHGHGSDGGHGSHEGHSDLQPGGAGETKPAKIEDNRSDNP
ncbi:MAG: DUF2933 domain-containing protein [Rhodospirillales bacterium]|tara:strand:+ start:11034 stop:11342 length:309 start_codon:yes stop_codon:yes gene_type:complete